MTAAIATLVLVALAQEPIPRHVYVTSSKGSERPTVETKDAARWNTVQIEGILVHLAKALDNQAIPLARKVLSEAVKGFPEGTLVSAEASSQAATDSLREVLLRSPFRRGLAGKVGMSRNPRAIIGPATTFEVENSGTRFELRTQPPFDDPQLAMSDDDLAPDPRAKEFESMWSPVPFDVADQRLELLFEGPFVGQERFRAATLASRALEERMRKVEQEFSRGMREDIEGSFGKTGWVGKSDLAAGELPEALSRQLEAEARMRYQQLGFRTADEAWAAVRNGRLKLKSLSLVVVVRAGSHVQYFPLDSGF